MDDQDLSRNPYSPAPDGTTAMSSMEGALPPGSFRIGDLFSLMVAVFKKHWLMGSVIILIYFMLSLGAVLVSSFGSLLGSALDTATGVFAGQLIATMANYLLQIPIAFGVNWAAFLAVRTYHEGKSLPIDSVIQGFRSFVPIVVIGLMRIGLLILVALPGLGIAWVIYTQVLGGAFTAESFELLDLTPPVLLGVGAFAFTALGLPAAYVLIRTGWAEYIAVEHNRVPVQSLKDSWSITTGNVGRIIGFVLLWFGLVLIASPFMALGVALTCAVGAFPLGFFLFLPNGVLYHELTKHIPGPALP